MEERNVRAEEGVSGQLHFSSFVSLPESEDELWETLSYPSSSDDHGDVYPPLKQVPSLVNTPPATQPSRPKPSKDQDPWTLYDHHMKLWDIDALRSQEQVTPPSDGVGYEAEYTWVDEATLSEEQRTVVSHVLKGHSVFVSGSAGTYACLAICSRSVLLTRCLGTGKSYLIHAIVQAMRITGLRRIYKTATTGVASLHIGGRTIHSWSGIGLAEGNFKDIITSVCTDVSANERWAEAQLLIIDESELVAIDLGFQTPTHTNYSVSMMDGRTFDLLVCISYAMMSRAYQSPQESVARATRESEAPFGGLQVTSSLTRHRQFHSRSCLGRSFLLVTFFNCLQ
jgi:hypothetical protein